MRLNRRQFLVAGMATAATAIGSNRCGGGTKETTGTAGTNPGSTSRTQILSGRRLVIDFTGLAAFLLPRSPSDELTVLLVDGEATLGPGAAHDARLRIDPALVVVAESTAADGEEMVSPASGGGGLGAIAPVKRSFWDLKGHRLTLQSEGPAGLATVTGHRVPSTKVPGSDAAAQADVSWLPSMARIAAAGQGRINAACLAPDPRSAKIASRLQFSRGQVSARFRPGFQSVAWRIGRTGEATPLEEAIGELRLSQPLTADKLVFTLEPFGGGPAKRVVLTAKPTETTAVEIRNIPAHAACTNVEQARNLDHFRAYYQLLATAASGELPIPVCPTPGCDIQCGALAEGEPILCPASGYDPPPAP